MRLILLLAVICPGMGWACGMPGCTVNHLWAEEFRLLKVVRSSSTNIPFTMETTLYEDNWYVMKGSETLTLDEFVKSGKFCAVYGHRWADELYFGAITVAVDWEWKCSVCKRWRRKIKKQKEVEDWEP